MRSYPMRAIAYLTRQLQARRARPIRGVTRLSNLLARWSAYQGVVTLPNGVRMTLDSRQSAERWLLFSGNYQPALTAFLKRHTQPGHICMDIGANLGFYTLSFAHWTGPQGYVIAAEANPDLAQRVAHDVALNGFEHVTVIDRPVHVRAEPVTFHIADAAGKSSIHAAHVTHPQQVLTLTATTIDQIVDEQALPRVDVIKLDIEGNDCNALLGARDTLARCTPVLAFEYWYSTPPQTAGAAFELLDNLGYQVAGLQRDGTRVPVRWQDATPAKHLDVIATVKQDL